MWVELETPGLVSWIGEYLKFEARPAMIDRWVARTEAAIAVEVEDIVRQPELADLLRTMVRDHWVAFLRQLSESKLHFELVDTARLLATELAAHHFGLESMIKIYRAAQLDVWTYATEVAKDVPPSLCDPSTVLVYFWSRAAGWIDASIEASTAVFRAEEERLASSAAARRFEVVRELLAGRTDDPARISAALGGYPLTFHHTALVLSGAEHMSVTALENLVGKAAHALNAPAPLVVRPGGHRSWAWLSTRGVAQVESLHALLATHETTAGVRIGIGSPAQGIDGFVVSHEEARDAHDVATRTDRVIVSYVDVELVSIIDCNPRVERFVHRVLGDLTSDDAATQRLRETLAAYLRARGNLEQCAAILCVHRNTVRYRMRQVEEVLGASVNKFSGELDLALQHFQVHHES